MKILIVLTFYLFSLTFTTAFAQESYEVKQISILDVNSSINPATFNYLKTNLTKLTEQKGDLAILKLDTPGGLVTTTKDIITLIGKTKVPFIVWITPEGASATSAGAIIASSAHLLVMSEGTNIGAATPVGLGKDIEKSDGKAKAVNDLVALVKSLSKARGRNADRFAEMISKASSFDSQTALKEKIINGIVNTQADLISFLNDKEVKVLGKDLKITINPNVEIKNFEMDPGQKILDIFANPMFAYILFVIGAALLYLEVQAPGGFVAGAIGAVCLVLAAIGFQVLPLNFGALGLIVLSFVLFILEAYITSYGILTLGGIASLVFGSLFLFRTENAYLDIQLPMILSVVAAIVIYVIIIAMVIIKTRKKQQHFFKNKDTFGHILKFIGMDGDRFMYQVKVNGEIWNTTTDSEFTANEKVKVTDQDDEHTKVLITKI